MSLESFKNSNFRLPVSSRLSFAVLIAAAIAYAVNVYRFHLERWDDAYITFRFARHVAEGKGLIWNIGGEPVEGFTSLLHVLLLAAGIKAEIDPWRGSLILSVAAVAATVGVMLFVARRQFGSIHPLAATFVGLYLVDSITALHTASGLETQLFAALLAACYLAAFSFIEKPSGAAAIILGALVFLSCLCRPEAVIYGFAVYFSLAFYCVRSDEKRACFLKLSASTGLVACGGLIYAAWKYNYFGYFLPNPYYVKSNDFALSGVSETIGFLKHSARWLAPLWAIGMLLILTGRLKKRTVFGKTSAAALLKSSFGKQQTQAKIMLTLLPPMLALAYYSTIIHEVGGGYRFSYPTYFYFVTASALFLVRLIKTARIGETAHSILLAGAVLWLGLLIVQQRVWRVTPLPVSAFNQYHFRIAAALKATELGAEGTIMCDAAGIITYVSGFNQVDRVGLTDNFLSGRTAPSVIERENYFWSRPADVYIGYEPPALRGAALPSDDRQMRTPYIADVLLKRRLTLIESRIFVQDAALLHTRMRHLRDRWYLIGELDFPGWQAWHLKSFVYVRRGSPHAAVLISKLSEIVKFRPEQINLHDIETP